jgi:predicted amidohydrolase
MTKLKIATCQFPVSSNIARNLGFVRRQAERAAALGAEVAHFPEAALSGYAGVNLTARAGYDWPALRAATERVQDVAGKLGMWVIVGSAHPLSGDHKPHNSVYVIGPDGALVDRYDKLFCTKQDLKHYTPGDYFAVFDIRGVRCGLLICHDLRYPELYREYYRRGVRVLFQSFYNASTSGPTIHTVIVQPTMQAHAANNYMWMSVANASGSYQAWPSFFVSPEGRVLGRLRRHQPGVLVREVDTAAPIKDKCGFRDRAMAGVLHSGEPADDPRSRERRAL